MSTWISLQETMQHLPAPIGERLCLNFTNTIEPRGGPANIVPLSDEQRASQREYLANYHHFVAWSLHVGLVMKEEAVALLEQASHQPLQVQETLTQIITLREQLYTIFWSMASGRFLEKQELDIVQRVYLDALSHAKLSKSREQYVWQWSIEKECLTSPLWPIIQSAVELLATGDATRIKVCPGAPRQTVACGWLFYDESKNKTRHWCSMADCGKRAKARRLTEHRRVARQKQRAF